MRYFRLRTRGGTPIGIMAVGRIGRELRAAASLCSPHDTWDPRAGIAKACGRLNSHRLSVRVDRGQGAAATLLALYGTECSLLGEINLTKAGIDLGRAVDAVLKEGEIREAG